MYPSILKHNGIKSLTHQKVSDLLNEFFQFLVGVLKEFLLALSFIKSVLCLPLHVLGEYSDVLKLRGR